MQIFPLIDLSQICLDDQGNNDGLDPEFQKNQIKPPLKLNRLFCDHPTDPSEFGEGRLK